MKYSEVDKNMEAPGSASPGESNLTAADNPASGSQDSEALQQQAAKAEENWQRLLRATADFDNYKKRVVREKQESIKYANEALLAKLMPVLDNFEAALAAATQANSSDAAMQSMQTGVNMIFQQLKSTLAEAGLEEIDARGQPFDPNWHEAVSQQESSDVAEGQVLQQLRKGYRLKDRLLRPATVIVAKKPAS